MRIQRRDVPIFQQIRNIKQFGKVKTVLFPCFGMRSNIIQFSKFGRESYMSGIVKSGLRESNHTVLQGKILSLVSDIDIEGSVKS